MRCKPLPRWVRAAAIVAAACGVVSAQEAPPPALAPAEFGARFPAATFDNLNEGPGGVASIDLARVIGKKPVVLCYWIAGNRRSETVFTELQSLADELGPTKLVLYGVVTERPGLGRDQILERIRALKIHVPVLNDKEFAIGQRLQVRSVPSISIIDAEGKLRLANGGSLRQPLEYKMEIQDAVRRVAETGELGTYGPLEKWYPVQELVGRRCPDFSAPLLADGRVRRWSQMIAPDKINVLMFWSVDCPHCRKTLPELNDWLKAHPAGINVVGAASVENDTVRTKTEQFCKGEGLIFPTFLDKDRRIGEQFLVVSTPTFVIVGPDGVVDSVVLSGGEDIGKKLEAKEKEILKGSGA